nr:uncharacterized protein LOC129163975 [Nothobranchius furzeri]
MLFRVIVSPDNIRRVDISESLCSVEHLKNILQECLELAGDILIQFEDPDFGNELCNLTDIKELPKDKAVLKILYQGAIQQRDESASSISSTPSLNDLAPSTSRSRSSTLHLTQRDSGMENTFSMRRKEIVGKQPFVSDVMNRWLALFFEEQICAEFFRVTRVELMKTFLSSLDEHSAQLIKLYRSRSGKLDKELKNLLDIFDEKTTDVLEYRKSTALRGLPLYLKEQSDGFLKTCLDTDPVDVAVQGMELGILTVVEDDVGTVNSFPTTRSIALIIEEQIVLDDISSFPTAFALLFGLIYALNLDYPKNLRYTFEATQKGFLSLGTDCSARVQALKNSLLK